MSSEDINDTDFIQDMNSLNLDDASINMEQQTTNSQDDKLSSIIVQKPAQDTNKTDSTTNNTNTKTKKHNKHRSQAQNSTKKKPVIDLSSFNFGAIDEINDKSSIHISDHNIQSEFEIASAQPATLEENVITYLNKSLSSLKSDVLNEIEFIINRKNMISSIIDSFLINISSEIKNEIHNLQSISISDCPMNISIEIDIPKPKPFLFKTIDADQFLSQVSYLKSQYSQNFFNIKNDISNAIKSRDSAISKILRERKQLSSRLYNLQDKSFSLKTTFDELEHSLSLISKQNFNLSEKINEFEDDAYNVEITKSTLKEIQNSIDDLSNAIDETNQANKNRSLYQKMEAIKRETKDVYNITDDVTIQISNFFSNWKKTNFQNNFYNQPNRSENILRFSAPPYSNYSMQSSLFSSTSRLMDSSELSLNNRIRDKQQSYSPIYIRQRPNYHIESDDENDEENEISQVNNYLLNKKFSPLMSDYS